MTILDSNKKMTFGTGPHNQHQLVLCGSGPLQFCAFCIHNSMISFQEIVPTVKATLLQGVRKLIHVQFAISDPCYFAHKFRH